jgi:hypothetical protein
MSLQTSMVHQLWFALLFTTVWYSWLGFEDCIADLRTPSRCLMSIVRALVHGSQRRHPRKAGTGLKVHTVSPTWKNANLEFIVQESFRPLHSVLCTTHHTDYLRLGPSLLLQIILRTSRSSTRIPVGDPPDGSATSKQASCRSDFPAE